MNLETLVMCLAYSYAWNSELCNMRTLSETLRRIAERVDEIANDVESQNASTENAEQLAAIGKRDRPVDVVDTGV